MGPIRHIRKEILKVSQAELATLTGVTQATVSRWESGELEPDRKDMKVIRDTAIERGAQWDDNLFWRDDMGEAAGAAA